MAFGIADWYDKTVHAGAFVAGDELGKYGGQLRVFGCAADIIFTSTGSGGVDNELIGFRVERCRCFEALYITAVSRFGHGETAEQVEIDEVFNVGIMVSFGSK